MTTLTPETIAAIRARAEQAAILANGQSGPDSATRKALRFVVIDQKALLAEVARLTAELETDTRRASEFHQMYEPTMVKLMGMFDLLNSPDDHVTRLELALKHIQAMPPDMMCQEIDEICHAALGGSL